MAKTTQRFARAQLSKLAEMHKHKEASKDSVLTICFKQNTNTAKEFGYKYASCLCCGNHDTDICKTC